MFHKYFVSFFQLVQIYAISEDEAKTLTFNKEYNQFKKEDFSLFSGIGIFLGFILKPLLTNMVVSKVFSINLLMIITFVIATIFFRVFISKKKKIAIESNKNIQVKLVPRSKEFIIKMIVILFLLIYGMVGMMFVFLDTTDMIFLIGGTICLLSLVFFNMFCNSYKEVELKFKK